jgi:hypothetical protein
MSQKKVQQNKEELKETESILNDGELEGVSGGRYVKEPTACSKFVYAAGKEGTQYCLICLYHNNGCSYGK